MTNIRKFTDDEIRTINVGRKISCYGLICPVCRLFRVGRHGHIVDFERRLLWLNSCIRFRLVIIVIVHGLIM